MSVSVSQSLPEAVEHPLLAVEDVLRAGVAEPGEERRLDAAARGHRVDRVLHHRELAGDGRARA